MQPRMLVLFIFAIGSLFTQTRLYHSSFVFLDAWLLLFFGIGAPIAFIITIFIDIRQYRATKERASFIPSMIGVFFIFVITSVYFYYDSKRSGPSLLYAYHDGGFNGFGLDLKENGNFVMTSASALGSSVSYYGTYSIRDSLIFLDRKNIDLVLESDKLVIKYDTFDVANGQDEKKVIAYITQVDDDGKEIAFLSHLRLTVVSDNRKNKLKGQ